MKRLYSALIVALVLGGCSTHKESLSVGAPQQTDDRTGVSQYSTEFPPPYHRWAIEQSRRAGR